MKERGACILICLAFVGIGQVWAAEVGQGKELFRLVKNEDAKKAAKLLKNKNIDINYQDPSAEMTPLQMAVSKNNVKICKLLIKAGANLELKNKLNNTPLMTAIYDMDFELIKLLVDSGANPNSKNGLREDLTPLMFAASAGNNRIVKLLLKAGADLEILGKDNRTALVLAAYYGKLETVKILVNFGADITSSGAGLTGAAAAQENGHQEIVAYLKKIKEQRARNN